MGRFKFFSKPRVDVGGIKSDIKYSVRKDPMSDAQKLIAAKDAPEFNTKADIDNAFRYSKSIKQLDLPGGKTLFQDIDPNNPKTVIRSFTIKSDLDIDIELPPGSKVELSKLEYDRQIKLNADRIDAELQKPEKFEAEVKKMEEAAVKIEGDLKDLGIEGKFDDIDTRLKKMEELQTKMKNNITKNVDGERVTSIDQSKKEIEVKKFFEKHPKIAEKWAELGIKWKLAGLGALVLTAYCLIKNISPGEGIADAANLGTGTMAKVAVAAIKGGLDAAVEVAPELIDATSEIVKVGAGAAEKIGGSVFKTVGSNIMDFFRTASTLTLAVLGVAVAVPVLKLLLGGESKQTGGGKNRNLLLIYGLVCAMLLIYTSENIEFFKPDDKMIVFLNTDYKRYIDKKTKNTTFIETKDFVDFLRKLSNDTSLANFMTKIIQHQDIGQLLEEYKVLYKDERRLKAIRYDFMMELLMRLRNNKELRSQHIHYFEKYN